MQARAADASSSMVTLVSVHTEQDGGDMKSECELEAESPARLVPVPHHRLVSLLQVPNARHKLDQNPTMRPH